MNCGLDEHVIEMIIAVFEHYPSIEKAVLYGSRAKGSFKNCSDIDLTLFGKDLDLSALAKIDAELDDLLLPYTFDLSLYSHISNHDLLDHIQRVGIVFYEQV